MKTSRPIVAWTAGVLASLAACGVPVGEDLTGSWQRSDLPGAVVGFIRLTFLSGGRFEYLSELRNTLDGGEPSAGCATQTDGGGDWAAWQADDGQRHFKLVGSVNAATDGCPNPADNRATQIRLEDTFRYTVDSTVMSVIRVFPDAGVGPTLIYRTYP